MKQKIKQIKSHMRGSILAYSLIIMSIMLATALSIASVSVLERKNASSTGSSVQAFAVADSGTEIILQKVRRDGHTTAQELASNLPFQWTATTVNNTCIITGPIAGGEAEIILKDEADAVIQDCTLDTTVQSVKSTGKYLGTTRAVEVAVASDEGSPNLCQNLEISSTVQTASNIFLAMQACRDMSGGDWYLPTFDELTCFVGMTGATTDSLMTRTPHGSSCDGRNYVRLKLDSEFADMWCSISSPIKFRCVKHIENTWAANKSCEAMVLQEKQTSASRFNAIQKCRAKGPEYNLPNFDELACFIGVDGYTTDIEERPGDLLFTRDYGTYRYGLNLLTAEHTDGLGSPDYHRCVKYVGL